MGRTESALLNVLVANGGSLGICWLVDWTARGLGLRPPIVAEDLRVMEFDGLVRFVPATQRTGASYELVE